MAELDRLFRNVPDFWRGRHPHSPSSSPPPYAPVQPVPQRIPPPAGAAGAVALPPAEPDPAPLKCATCLDSLGEGSQLSTTMCGHIFCADCIKESSKWQKKCPICRKVLKGKNPFIRLYT
ncbi:hypothetical protein HDU89_002295 [Geranomyces variabilis]|nr:hypothetical protein HDU89_002295 [Geranomyces variabilis]